MLARTSGSRPWAESMMFWRVMSAPFNFATTSLGSGAPGLAGAVAGAAAGAAGSVVVLLSWAQPSPALKARRAPAVNAWRKI